MIRPACADYPACHSRESQSFNFAIGRSQSIGTDGQRKRFARWQCNAAGIAGGDRLTVDRDRHHDIGIARREYSGRSRRKYVQCSISIIPGTFAAKQSSGNNKQTPVDGPRLSDAAIGYVAAAGLDEFVGQVFKSAAAGIGYQYFVDAGPQSAFDKAVQGVDHFFPKTDIGADHQVIAFERGRFYAVEVAFHHSDVNLIDLGVDIQVGKDLRVDIHAGNIGLMVLGAVHAGQSPAATDFQYRAALCQALFPEIIHYQPGRGPEFIAVNRWCVATFKPPDIGMIGKQHADAICLNAVLRCCGHCCCIYSGCVDSLKGSAKLVRICGA